MDKALWITWYDLPPENRTAYFSWLHETYIPLVLKRPGMLWGAHYAEIDKSLQQVTSSRLNSPLHYTGDPSIPTGSHYVLIFGAEHAGMFGNPVPSALNAELPGESRKMLAIRTGERVNIMVEQDRIECAESKTYPPGKLLAPLIQLAAFNCPWQHEEALLEWHTQSRMPAMGRTAGVIRFRKFVSVAGWAKHGVLYEFASIEARDQHYLTHQDGHPDMKAWSDRVLHETLHAPSSPSLARRIWPR